MRRGLALGIAALLLVLLGWSLVSAQRRGPVRPGTSARPATPAVGIRVANGRLVEADGSDLLLRGINHGYPWSPSHTGAFADIKAAGANTVRVAISSGQRWPANSADDVASVVALCKRNRLICVLDVHDTIGL